MKIKCPNINNNLKCKKFTWSNNSQCASCSKYKYRNLDYISFINNTWVKYCVRCRKKKYYTSFRGAVRGIELCLTCYRFDVFKKTLPLEIKAYQIKNKKWFIRNCLKCNEEIKYTDGYSATYAYKNKLSCKSCGGMANKTHSKNTKQKMRIARINSIESNNGQISPNYNPTSIYYLDWLSAWNGWNLQHAENGGEYHIKKLGYFVDGYDKKNNIVVEFYENAHYNNGKLSDRDIAREIDIKKYLNCILFRLPGKTKILERMA